MSSYFSMNTRVRQGYALSPSVFKAWAHVNWVLSRVVNPSHCEASVGITLFLSIKYLEVLVKAL